MSVKYRWERTWHVYLITGNLLIFRHISLRYWCTIILQTWWNIPNHLDMCLRLLPPYLRIMQAQEEC